MTVAGQTVVSYSYDNADRLMGITQGTTNVAFSYDDANRRTALTLPNGIVVEYGYDSVSQLTALTYKLGQSTLGTLTYGYDLVGRQTGAGGTWARTGLPAALTSASYNNANQITQFGGTTFTYDANGNLTGDGVRTYTWNARDQLANLTGPTNGSFAYDAFGRRRARTVGASTIQFLYNGRNPVQELTGGTPTANLLTGLGLDEIFKRTDGAGANTFLADGVGSTIALADSSGTVQTSYTYEPFGVTTVSGAASANAFQYTGRENDGTGLYYYRARYYDPQGQRFLTEDPLDFKAGDVNLYAYVGNAPTTFVDPTGLVAFLPPPSCRPPGRKPPLSWWLRCSPALVPDLVPLPILPHLIPHPGPAPQPPPQHPWPGNDPTQAPPGTTWRGKPGSAPGSPDGNYYNPRTGESFRPDLNHPDPPGPHWDYRAPDGKWYRIMPDGTLSPRP